MAIKDVESKCWILALFVRDDGERFLLGDGSYEFSEKQLHFTANTMANDVVEVQGNDGYLLAGQVRRPSTQTFDGYVGDSSTSKAVVEERRRAFFEFFRKNFFYKVIYIFPDGSAIQRKRGFLVDAPEVKEIRQIYPEYHVALNFEDINYYYYDEDSDGQEIYGKSATINLNSVAQSGGLIWLSPSEVTLTGEGTSFTLSGTVNGTALTSAEVKGNTFQQTYSGKNLIDWTEYGTNQGITTTLNSDGSITASGTATGTYPNLTNRLAGLNIPAGTYTVSIKNAVPYDICFAGQYMGGNRYTIAAIPSGSTSVTFTTTNTLVEADLWIRDVAVGDNINFTVYPMLEEGSTATSYEPYVGGIAAPNPDYPQEVQTATGRQVVTISNATESQEYEINLGKNLFAMPSSQTVNGVTMTVHDDGTFDLSGTASATGIFYVIKPLSETNLIGGDTYTLHIPQDMQWALPIFVQSSQADGTYSKQLIAGGLQTGTSKTAVLENPDTQYVKFIIQVVNGNTYNLQNFYVQLELGSATSYAAYFEPIELCKIGDYQDRIYKSGSDWYLHKEIGKFIADGTYGGYNSTYNWFYNSPASYGEGSASNGAVPISNSFIGYQRTIFATNTSLNGCSIDSASTNPPVLIRNTTLGTAADYKSWLATLKPIFYYVLATPTDTQITNTALITQLNALAAATTYNGTTSFTVDGNGNLAAILAVEVEASGGGGVEWDENGAVWEEGKPSYSIISVDSIDNVYPVLTITGRTVNPVLTDVTTGTIFQYNGTITESQVLRVDMMNKTATLNGVSVIGNVTGDWLYLAPGNNRVTYTADNADAPNATVEWQEIVG